MIDPITLQSISILVSSIGLIIALVYYTVNIRNQNRTRQAQLLMQVYNRFDSPDKVRAYQEVFHWEFRDFEEYSEKYGRYNNPEAHNTLTSLIVFFEGIGTLVKTRDLPIDRVYLLMGGLTIILWEKFELVKEQIREDLNFPRWACETEYLYNELIRYRAEHPELKT